MNIQIDNSQNADYLIIGGGCAGLSLAARMAKNSFFRDKKIIILEENSKETDDRTWCFWEKKQGFFEQIVSQKWSDVYFYSAFFSKKLNIKPYEYKMIRGIDFYNHCKNIISQSPNIQWIKEKVSRVGEDADFAFAEVNGEKIKAKYIFNSVRFEEPDYSETHNLLQHFKGWYIETENSFFNPNEATLMDFRIEQKDEVRFFYVLPLSDKKALIEFTIFSEKLLEKETLYDVEVKNYIADYLKLSNYTIFHQEFGVIPMTNADFKTKVSPKITNIGITSGAARPSTGYTFTNIQKNCDTIITQITTGEEPNLEKTWWQKRHWLYDTAILHVLRFHKYSGAKIFARLFRWNKSKQIFKFLDGETNFLEEYRIMNTTPIHIFLVAVVKEIWKLIFKRK